MGWFTEIHTDCKNKLAEELRKKGHDVAVEYRAGPGAIFDVYDKSNGTAYEVLTAKYEKSAHEQEEMLFSKLFRYSLVCKKLVFVLAGFEDVDIPHFHNMRLAHWHWRYAWPGWAGRLKPAYKKEFHDGVDPLIYTHRFYHRLKALAPIKEWTGEKRRKRHPFPIPPKILAANKRWGLPVNTLKGLWRDWRLQWIWKLEKILPKWERLFKKSKKKGR